MQTHHVIERRGQQPSANGFFVRRANGVVVAGPYTRHREARQEAARLDALAHYAALYDGRMPCPHCGGEEDHDDNGQLVGTRDYTLICPCGEQWTPYDP